MYLLKANNTRYRTMACAITKTKYPRLVLNIELLKVEITNKVLIKLISSRPGSTGTMVSIPQK